MSGTIDDVGKDGLLFEEPIPASDDGDTRAKVRALYRLLERFSIRWSQGMYTIVDKTPDDPYISELLIHLEALRGKVINRVEVFVSNVPYDYRYQMGFNDSPSRVSAITQFMRAYTYEEFPAWRKIDHIAMDIVNDKYNLPPFPQGPNPYERLFAGGYTYSRGGNLVFNKEYADHTETFGFSPGACNMEKVYKLIDNVVQRAYNYRRLLNETIRLQLTVPPDLDFESCPTLEELCCSKIYHMTIKQDPYTFKDRSDAFPHWIKPMKWIHKETGYECGLLNDQMPKPRGTPPPYEGHIPLLRPDYYHHLGAFKTGSSPKGIFDNLMKANRDRMTTSAEEKHILAAILSIFRTFNLYDSVEPYISYEEFMDVLVKMSVPWDRNAGIHFTKSENLGTYKHVFDDLDPKKKVFVEEQRRYGPDADRKENAFPAVCHMIEDLLFRLHKKCSMSMFYNREWFPLLTAKLGNKVEILFPEADRSKNRIFFISSLMKMVLHKMLLAAPLNNVYGRSFVGVGHCWSKGGVYRVGKQLHFSDLGEVPRSWFMGDFSALDQSLKAGILCLLGIIWIFSVRSTGDPNKSTQERVMEQLTAWMADDTAITLVKWFEAEWRLVFGILFSGEYITSIFDTFYVYIAILVCHYVLADRLKALDSQAGARARVLLMEDLEQFTLIYGDDLCWTLRDETIHAIEDLLGIKYLDEIVVILKEKFDMVLKPPGSSDTNQYSTPFANMSWDGCLLPDKDNNYGFKWLRRYFSPVLIRTSVGCFKSMVAVRKISDYWAKASNTHHDAMTYPNHKWLQRIKAFCVENMGASIVIDKFCRMFYAALKEFPIQVSDVIELEEEIPVKGRVSSIDGRAVFDGVKYDSVEKKKYLMVDPDIPPYFCTNDYLPTRSELISEFGTYTSAAAFEASLRSCNKMAQGPLIPPRGV